MVERREPQLRVTAAQFNAARANAPGGELRKIDTETLGAAPISGPAKPKVEGGNTSWPWLPPGQHGNDKRLRVPVSGTWDAASVYARRGAAGTDDMVSVQTKVNSEGTMVIGDSWISTAFLTPNAARLLAAQLLQAAHEAER